MNFHFEDHIVSRFINDVIKKEVQLKCTSNLKIRDKFEIPYKHILIPPSFVIKNFQSRYIYTRILFVEQRDYFIVSKNFFPKSTKQEIHRILSFPRYLFIRHRLLMEQSSTINCLVTITNYRLY